MKTSCRLLLIVGLTTLLSVGCGGGDMYVRADALQYPVSTTQGLFDSNYRLLGEENFKVIDTVEINVSKWHILWTAIPLSSDPDISEQLNKAVEKKGGDGIINLQISITGGNVATGLLTWISSAVPVLPSVIEARITGDVVKLRK